MTKSHPTPPVLLAEGWQPIETAPDQRDVLLYRCGWPLIIAGRFYNGEEWGWSSIEAPDDWIDGEPTHWMPLPDPPVQP